MRAITFIVSATLVTACIAATSLLPAHVAILPASEAAASLKQCSRRSPPNVSGGWDVSPQLASQIEVDLPKLAKQMRGANPLAFYRQYVGIVQSGKRLVYINAFTLHTSEKLGSSWGNKPFIACDGGAQYWGAVYDPKTRQFSELAFNGVA